MRIATRSRSRLLTTLGLAVATLIAAPALAVVQFFGEVNPSDPGDGDLEETLEIGRGTDPNTDFPFGTVVVNGGDTLEIDEVYVGDDAGYFGRLLVSGVNGSFGPSTIFRVEGSGSTAEPAMQVGRAGDGYLLVESGAWIDFESNAGDLSIGDQDGGVGHAVVRDTYSLVTIPDDLIVGNQGIGRLDITAGAVVRTEQLAGSVISIGASAGGVGEVLVSGSGSRLSGSDDLSVGVLGVGTLTITDNAIVNVNNSLASITTVGAGGRIALDGGTLQVQTFNLNGVLGGSGLVRGDGTGGGVLTASSGARIEAGPGQRLVFNDDVNSQAAISIDAGEIEFKSGFTNLPQGSGAAPGRITLDDGRVTFSEGLDNDGVIAFTSGSSDVHGEVTNDTAGAITVARDTVATFHDDFTDDGGTLTILAGGNALFLSDLAFQAASTLVLELDDNEGSGPGTLLSVSGNASLAGEIRIDLPDGFTPEPGQTFSLIEADSFSGGFIPPIFPTLEGGLQLGLVSDGGVISLAVSDPGLPGDFNNDGIVNAADYTVWRDGLGFEFTPNDRLIWAGNYGATAGGSASAAVPEPTTAWLALAATAAAVGGPRRRG